MARTVFARLVQFSASPTRNDSCYNGFKAKRIPFISDFIIFPLSIFWRNYVIRVLEFPEYFHILFLIQDISDRGWVYCQIHWQSSFGSEGTWPCIRHLSRFLAIKMPKPKGKKDGGKKPWEDSTGKIVSTERLASHRPWTCRSVQSSFLFHENDVSGSSIDFELAEIEAYD